MDPIGLQGQFFVTRDFGQSMVSLRRVRERTMNNPLIFGSLLVLAVPVSSVAQNGFDGTWKVDFQSAMPTKVNVWLLKDGMYSCTSCSPSIEVKADGKDQASQRSAVRHN